MTMLRSQLELDLCPDNGDFQWPESTDDLFDSLINPDSFHLPAGQDRHNKPNDPLKFYETYPSFSGSGSLDVCTVPDLALRTWQCSASSVERHRDGSPERFECYMSICSAPSRKVAYSESDSASTPVGGVDLENECSPHAATASSTPRWRNKDRGLLGATLSIKSRHLSASPSRVEKTQYRDSNLRRASSYRASKGGRMLMKTIQDAALAARIEMRSTTPCYTLATPPSSTQSRSGSLELDFIEEQAVSSPGFDYSDLEYPMSPQASAYSRLQNNSTPANTPGVIEHDLPSPHVGPSSAEPHSQLSSYPSSPLDPHPESFSLTPPATQPMNTNQWSPEEIPFMQVLASPANKADGWAFTGDPSEVTCGGPAAAPSAGLGLSFADHDNADRGRGLDYEMFGPTAGIQGSQHYSLIHQPQASPTPSRPLSADYSTVALSPGLSQNMYPMDPLLEQGHHDLTYALSPSRQQASPAYSPQMQPRDPFRPTHQRSYTIGAPISSTPPAILVQPAFGEANFPTNLQSPSPPPHRGRALSSKQRSKSAHQSRRKSSVGVGGHSRQAGAANVGFVNFTPDDSKRILTGVAPSGSSKTKARREREAAEKRRKLSEAAKRAVLKAGGDLGDLDREVLELED